MHPEQWETSMKILVILAHPDDPEFFCGGTIARWIQVGHRVNYFLFTRGDKGSNDASVSSEDLAKIREEEQRNAANVLGVESVEFLGVPDGELMPELNLRREVVKVIRKVRPDILVTSDPQNFFPRQNYLNHPDHRNAGLIVLDAYFPACGSPMFFRDLADEGLLPHSVKEIWISLTNSPNIKVDVTGTWEIKIKALLKHKSQIGPPDAFIERMKSRHTDDSMIELPRYEEAFYRIVFG